MLIKVNSFRHPITCHITFDPALNATPFLTTDRSTPTVSTVPPVQQDIQREQLDNELSSAPRPSQPSLEEMTLTGTLPRLLLQRSLQLRLALLAQPRLPHSLRPNPTVPVT